MYALRVFLGINLSVQNLISVLSIKISSIKSISTMAMLHRLQRKWMITKWKQELRWIASGLSI
jgi:hypothetical protein